MLPGLRFCHPCNANVRRPPRSTSPRPTTACFVEDVRGWPKDSRQRKIFVLESFGRLHSSQWRGRRRCHAAADPFERNEEWVMTDASARSVKAAVLALTSVASFMAALDALV